MRSSGRVSVSVWGAISYDGLGPLYRIPGRMTAEVYAEVAETVLLPYVLDGPFPDGLYHFQQDGASVHSAKTVRDLFERLGVMTLPWPARSPDLNIIENVWGLMKKSLSKKSGLSNCNPDGLWEAIENEWGHLRNDRALVDSLYESLPKRIEILKKSGGAPIRY